MVIKGLIRPETVHTSTGSTQARARDQSKPYVFDLELDWRFAKKKLHIHITAHYVYPRLRAFGQSLLGEKGKAYMYQVCSRPISIGYVGPVGRDQGQARGVE